MSDPSLTFCTCIEAGQLEWQVVTLVESLRKFGGRLADAPFLAVRPRAGAPLQRSTKRALDAMNVRVLDVRPSNPYPWYTFLNKPVTLIEAERHATTRNVAWLDGDIIVASCPDGLDLDDATDFAAVAPDKNVGTAGPDDGNDAYWREAGKVIGVDVDTLPWVVTERERERIRMYFNGGVFSVRRGMGIGDAYFDATVKLLDARISSKAAGLFFHEQVALALTVRKMNLRWTGLPQAYNYSTGAKVDHHYDPADLQAAKLLHYHSSLYPPYWAKFTGYLTQEKPEIAGWVKSKGPMPASVPFLSKAITKLLRNRNEKRSKRHAAACRVI
jgi:hypothetical protein